MSVSIDEFYNMQNHQDTQRIALEVRGISTTLENLNESRKRHDEKATERFLKIESELSIIGKDIAASQEFKRQLIIQNEHMTKALEALTALSNQAKGGWWSLCTMAAVFSAAGGGIALWLAQIFKK